MSVCLKPGKIIMLLGMLAALCCLTLHGQGWNGRHILILQASLTEPFLLPIVPAFPSIRAVFSLILLNLMMSGFLLNRMNLALTMTPLT